MDYLNASESTIRRDLNALDKKGELVKVHGGAVASKTSFKMRDDDVSDRRVINMDEKRRIAKYAASLIKPDDFVYIDAGTTTEYITDYITETNAIYVTNAVDHALKLARKGCEVYLTGGRLKSSTEAIVGAEASEILSGYNFTIGFWGTNGIRRGTGFTTPDREEAGVKRISFKNCKRKYIVADSSKFDAISPVNFADFEEAVIITDKLPVGYDGCKNIIVVNKDGKEEIK
jgi:DeoR family fructose operon transcriptional repressor